MVINTNEPQDDSRVALVIGANGIVGSNMLRHLSEHTSWKLFGLARGAISPTSGATAISTDLLNKELSQEALNKIGPVDYLFFTALAVRQTPEEQVEPNMAMLRNAVMPLLDPSKKLRHISLVHGTKWYGSHLGPYKTPAQESDPRHIGPNFYYDQHDWLSEAQRHHQTWNFSTLRPHFINGFNVGNPNNMMAAIGAYAAVQKAEGRPFNFPGTQAAYETLTMVSDVSLVNAAMMWAATNPQCANQDFNIHNGEYFRWKNIWPLLAEVFDMPCGDVVPTKLSEYMVSRAVTWNRIVIEHGLKPIAIEQIVSWTWADFFFRGEWDDMSSVLKARNFGFNQFLDTQEDLIAGIERYRIEKVLP